MNEVQQRKQTDFTATDMPTTKKNNTSNITNFP